MLRSGILTAMLRPVAALLLVSLASSCGLAPAPSLPPGDGPGLVAFDADAPKDAAQWQRPQWQLGDTFTLADAACYNPVWFLKHDAALFAEVMARPALAAWFQRIESEPDAGISEMSPAAALAVTRDAQPVTLHTSASLTGLDYQLGDEVAVAADDYGPEQTRGRVTAVSGDSVTIERQDPALGAVAVHVPRAGYRVVKR